MINLLVGPVGSEVPDPYPVVRLCFTGQIATLISERLLMEPGAKVLVRNTTEFPV